MDKKISLFEQEKYSYLSDIGYAVIESASQCDNDIVINGADLEGHIKTLQWLLIEYNKNKEAYEWCANRGSIPIVKHRRSSNEICFTNNIDKKLQQCILSAGKYLESIGIDDGSITEVEEDIHNGNITVYLSRGYFEHFCGSSKNIRLGEFTGEDGVTVWFDWLDDLYLAKDGQ